MAAVELRDKKVDDGDAFVVLFKNICFDTGFVFGKMANVKWCTYWLCRAKMYP